MLVKFGVKLGGGAMTGGGGRGGGPEDRASWKRN